MKPLLPSVFKQSLTGPCDVRPGDTIVVGVSGGPDSLALLYLFVSVREALDLRLHAAHLNHGIRGTESDADAEFVRETAAAWEVSCTIEWEDVPAIAAARKLALEEAARQARYTMLARVAGQVGAELVAVGHNADDQAETVLMHLLRGAGLAGLRGMLPRTPLSAYHLLEPVETDVTLIRPLLDVPRAEIEAYCADHDLTPRFDRSNLDTTYFRNRLRHEVMPLLETLIPNVRTRLGRMASVLAADYACLQRQVGEAWERVCISESDTAIALDLASWRALPLALQRALVRQAAWRLRATLRDVSFIHIDNAVRVAQQGPTGAQATLLAGLLMRVGYDSLTISVEGEAPQEPDWPLLAPGDELTIAAGTYHEVPLPDGSWSFSIGIYEGERSGPDWETILRDPWAAPLDANALGERLTLRTRKPGDRFCPQGVGGAQKVSEFMINAKIPAPWRAHIPVLVAESGKIAWVVGWRVDERFLVTDKARRVALARFMRRGGNDDASPL
jgi:tRNA(Ile)-lysidine synthase